ncbi:pre-B-cell leukemia transcription factor-interacting protein 1 [Porphyrio hochstetteri]
MEEKPDSRDSDGSWVLTGSEGLPIDTVGPEQDSASRRGEEPEEEEEEEEEEEGTQDITSPRQPQHPESSRDVEERGDPKFGAAPLLDGPPEPGEEEEEEEEEADAEAEAEATPGSCPDTPKAGTPPWTPPPVSVPHRGAQGAGDEDGLNMSRYLLGALALVAVGLLIVSGGFYDAADGPMDTVVPQDTETSEQEAPPPMDGNVSKPPTPPHLGDPQSVQSMSILLDKLAKENQEIRLLQAELQAHKEELHALLQKSEGEAAAAGAQHRSLAAENARLTAALERESAALRHAHAQLDQLRAGGTPGSPPHLTDPKPGRPPSVDPKARGEHAARWGEGSRRRGGALASVRQELVGILERAGGPGGLEGLVEELRALEQRLGQELEREEPEPFRAPWKKPFKPEKNGKRHKRHEGRDPPPRERGKAPSPPTSPWTPRERKGGKTWGKPSHPPIIPHNPNQPPPFNRYRAPQGCSGVADCARKEGREVLGATLEPVTKVQFLELLKRFMEGLGWGEHFGGLAAQLEGGFGADGTFAHDRLRFTDFVDAVEELLEELAQRQHRGEEAADGFEEYVLRHYGGGAAKERGRESQEAAQGGGG